MRIFREVAINHITQPFGANYVPWYKQHGLKGHNGVDWRCNNGDKVYWGCDIRGTVDRLESDKWGGLGLDIITEDKDGIFKHRYWHLQKFLVKPGDVVESGQAIALADNTGHSTGSHLHRGLKRMSRDKNGNLHIKDRNNGYFGGIDPTPWFTNIFILHHMAAMKKKISVLRKMVRTIKRIISLIKKK